MIVCRYLQPRDGLPDANGSLAAEVSFRAIANANREVARVLKSQTSSKKRVPIQKVSRGGKRYKKARRLGLGG